MEGIRKAEPVLVLETAADKEVNNELGQVISNSLFSKDSATPLFSPDSELWVRN